MGWVTLSVKVKALKIDVTKNNQSQHKLTTSCLPSAVGLWPSDLDGDCKEKHKQQ